MAKAEKPSSAERLAAGVLGRRAPVKPAGKSTAQLHVDRFNARGRVDEPEPAVEPEQEEEPSASWADAQVRAARNQRIFLAEELAKAARGGGPDAA